MCDYEELGEKIIGSTIEMMDDEDSLSNQLMEILLNTREQGQIVEQLIKNQIEIKDDMIDKLHKELDYYKQEAAERFVDQVMKGIIKVRNDMARQIRSEKFCQMSADDLQREYEYIFEDLTDLLEQQNIDAYRSAEGDDFDASLHQPKSVPTDDPSLDKKIMESLSEGYTKGGKVFIPERVAVYQYK